MTRYSLLDYSGNALLVVEAADSIDAQLYGHHSVPGFSGRVKNVDEEERRCRQAETAMVEAIGRLTGISQPNCSRPSEASEAKPVVVERSKIDKWLGRHIARSGEAPIENRDGQIRGMGTGAHFVPPKTFNVALKETDRRPCSPVEISELVTDPFGIKR